MGTADIEAAINSTAEKKEDLRKAFDALQSYSSSLFAFTLQWKDIEDHFSSIEKSIEERFQELKEIDSSSVGKKAAATPPASKVGVNQGKPVAQPLSELMTLCVNMDGKGLRSFIIDNRKDIVAIRSELGAALLIAPDPAKLVLDSIDDFFPPENSVEAYLIAIRRTCLTLLECLHDLALEIKPLSRDRAREVAVEWRKLLNDAKGDTSAVTLAVTSLLVLGVLQLLVTFGLVDSFDVDDILDLIVLVAKRKTIVDLCRSAALDEHIPDLVDKLNNNGKQLDAVKFVIAFNLTGKYPPASLFKAYIKESKKTAQELRNKGRSKGEACAKEIAALRAVAKIVEEYKLGSLYSCENFPKRIKQLENQRAEKKPEKKLELPKTEKKPEKKRGAPALAASNSNVSGQKQQHEQPNKRPRPLASAPSVHAAHSFAHNHTQPGLVDLVPHAGLSGSYAFPSAPSLYNHGSASLSSNSVGLGGSRASSRYFPPEPLMGSTFYNRAMTNDSYPKSGLPAPYHSAFYF